MAYRESATEIAEYAAKYRVYERDYLRRINHKYFSGKSLGGTGRVFETSTTIDNFVIKETREVPIRKFLETPSTSEEQSRSGVIPSAAKKPVTRKS